MNFRPLSRIAATILVVGSGYSLPAEDGIEELAKTREAFEKEIAFATRPIRDRYLSRLESMKRSLGSRGDARAAAAVQDEIDRVNAMNPEPAGVVRFVGVWKIDYGKGNVRRYQISADGSVTWDENMGMPVKPPARAKLVLKGGDFLVEWGDGILERLKISSKNLVVDHFNPKTLYPAGQPSARGVGVNVAGR
jgi:hypothetical protein